ncbi:hypothetical protein HNP46_000369 [Pseudomonas nitritireducens]|uniref:Uncharacterized protein n=1 Tax=Pseudomonas nitroreducens TaxID=46680 RepID=A0A7W7KG90_PSENT|nr:hypothetical protein [Pseudomonas nitritireducens]MBB4861558.1 hypothetical protein [Pseudomonas nitritireducens]
MQFDRDIHPSGKGKYALINLRKLPGAMLTPHDVIQALQDHPEAIEFGQVGSQDEFMLIKLRDAHAGPMLEAYANSLEKDDPEFAQAVREMLSRAGTNSPFCKKPD